MIKGGDLDDVDDVITAGFRKMAIDVGEITAAKIGKIVIRDGMLL